MFVTVNIKAYGGSKARECCSVQRRKHCCNMCSCTSVNNCTAVPRCLGRGSSVRSFTEQLECALIRCPRRSTVCALNGPECQINKNQGHQLVLCSNWHNTHAWQSLEFYLICGLFKGVPGAAGVTQNCSSNTTEVVNCSDVARNRNKRWALANVVMKFGFHKMLECLTSCWNITFSRRTQLEGVNSGS
jgi:hypothetical protein